MDRHSPFRHALFNGPDGRGPLAICVAHLDATFVMTKLMWLEIVHGIPQSDFSGLGLGSFSRWFLFAPLVEAHLPAEIEDAARRWAQCLLAEVRETARPALSS